MRISVEITRNFESDAKPFFKKYRKFGEDLKSLKQSLELNPEQGVALGYNIYKVRLALTDKNKGKSGGARVITHVLMEIDKKRVRLISIYDKSEIDAVPVKEIKELVKRIIG
ncbi:hypothetical protein [Ekhidna sp.]|uniref:hypothetical protein n=1 Tax=Ekhidna sp. TaxID=2608089 RepID=UPI003CCBF4EF